MVCRSIQSSIVQEHLCLCGFHVLFAVITDYFSSQFVAFSPRPALLTFLGNSITTTFGALVLTNFLMNVPPFVLPPTRKLKTVFAATLALHFLATYTANAAYSSLNKSWTLSVQVFLLCNLHLMSRLLNHCLFFSLEPFFRPLQAKMERRHFSTLCWL